VRTDAATLAALRQENSNLKGRGDELERTHGLVKDDAGALRRRVGDVEAQLQRAADDASALRQQVNDLTSTNAQQQRRLLDLQAEAEATRRQLNEAQALQKKDDDAFTQRCKDVATVNEALRRMAQSPTTQQLLKGPKVRLALECWGSGEAAQRLTNEQLEAIKWDEGVIELYPALKEFEVTCERARIPFPVDAILAGHTELPEPALTAAYGPDFVTRRKAVQALRLRSP